MTDNQLIQTLSSFNLFRGFLPEEIEQILMAGEVRELEPGATLITPGTYNNFLFLLIEGELGVVLRKDHAEVTIPIHPGECLGEMSIVAGTLTSARVLAHTPGRVLVLSEAVFWDKLAMNRAGVQNLLRMMAQRLQRNNDALIEKVQNQMKYQLMEKELEMAGKIQANIVPDGNRLFTDVPEVEAAALINQAREVGGDFYDTLVLDDDHVYFVVGDVSGKGMPAALLMVRIVNSLRLYLDSSSKLEEVIPAVNRWLAKDNEDMMFVSLFAGILNVRTGLLCYVGAGHNPPFASVGGQPYAPLPLAGGLFLGIQQTSEYPISELQLQPGDSLLLYTDGITEAANAAGEMFEAELLQQALNRQRTQPMSAQVRALETAVERFVGAADQADDYTLLGVKYRGPS